MTPIDLKKFCSKDRKRPPIRKPFSQRGWTYATDGCIAIRVPRRSRIPERKDAPGAERIFNDADNRGPYKWVPVPEIKVEGQPFPFKFDEMTIFLNMIYLDLIRRELPNPQIGLIKEAGGNSPNVPVKIKFDGGEGLLMPVRL